MLTSLQNEIVKRYGTYKLERPVLKSRCPKKRPPFQFEPYQLFLQEFVRPSNELFGKGLLIVHSVGSGKTCGSLGTIRNFNDNFVWVTRTTLVQDPMKDLKNCAGIDPENVSSQKFLSYKQFANALTCDNKVGRMWYLKVGGNRRLKQGGIPSDRSIERKECRDPRLDPLKNKLVIIDEAHNLFDSQKVNHLTPEIVQNMIGKIHDSYKLSGENSCRVLLLSATPMRKDAMTLAKLLNILIPSAKNRLPTDKQTFMRRFIGTDGKLNHKKFCASTCGLISYLDVRGDLTRFPRREILPARNVSVSSLQAKRFDACEISLCHARIDKTVKSIGKKKDLLKTKQATLRKLKRTNKTSKERIKDLQQRIADIEEEVGRKQELLKTFERDLDECVSKEKSKRVYCMRRVLNFAVPRSEKEEVTGKLGRGRQSLPRSWRSDISKQSKRTSNNKKLGAVEKQENIVDEELLELKELQEMGLVKIEQEDMTEIFNPDRVREQIDESSPKLEAMLNQIAKILKKKKKSRHMLFSDLSRFGAMVIAAGLKAKGYPEIRFNPKTDLRDWKQEVKQARSDNRLPNWKMMFNFQDACKHKNTPAFILLTSSSLHYMGGRSLGKTRRNALIQYYNLQDSLPQEWPRITMVVLDGGFKEGIDLLETNHVWLFEPPVTQSDFEQIVGRVLRRCAHRSKRFGKEGWRVTVHTFQIVDNNNTVMSKKPLNMLQTPAERNMIHELTQAIQDIAIDRGLFEKFMKAKEWPTAPPKGKPGPRTKPPGTGHVALCNNEELRILNKEQLQTVAKALHLATGGSQNKLCIRIAKHLKSEKCGVVGEFKRRKGRPFFVCDKIVHLQDPYWVKCELLDKENRRQKCPRDCVQYASKEECDKLPEHCKWSKRGKGFCAQKAMDIKAKKTWVQSVIEALTATGGEASSEEIRNYIEQHIPERAVGGSWKSNLARTLLQQSRKAELWIKQPNNKYKLIKKIL